MGVRYTLGDHMTPERPYMYMLGGSDGHQLVPTTDSVEWGRWLRKAKYKQPTDKHGFLGPCRVGSTEVGEAWVSTVFLGLDHGWAPGPPVLFETMVFGGPFNEEQDRYCTWDEAVVGHAEMVKRIDTDAKRD